MRAIAADIASHDTADILFILSRTEICSVRLSHADDDDDALSQSIRAQFQYNTKFFSKTPFVCISISVPSQHIHYISTHNQQATTLQTGHKRAHKLATRELFKAVAVAYVCRNHQRVLRMACDEV